VSGDPEDSGAFRTPSLWGISKTAPFFHNELGGDGDFTGLINQYNFGGPRPKPKAHQVDDPLFPETTPLLVKLNLTESEREALAAFLKTL
jgi:cytochrome c peroxidase